MPKILINGYFLCRQLTGVERYALEITRRLDKITAYHEAALIVPSNLEHIPGYKNIQIIRCGKKIPHIFWQMLTLQFFLLTHREYVILDFGNTCLPFAPGIVFLHDIYCEFFPEDFTSLHDKLIRLYNKWQYRLIARKARRIVTVSQFSKGQIAEAYHVEPDRISVIYNGWEHFKNIVPDYTVFTEHAELTARPFYFALGSLSKRKNLNWIAAYAVQHPDTLFAVSGTRIPTAKARITGVPPNIIILGYLGDEKVKALMSRCKAFIQPSYYEGFGIPPLEALSCGAKIIVARAASLPEIYGHTAHYIDPFDTDADLDALLREPVDPPDAVLEKYSYDSAAGQVYELMKGFYGNT